MTDKPTDRVADPVSLPGSGSVFQISLPNSLPSVLHVCLRELGLVSRALYRDGEGGGRDGVGE